MVFAFAGDSTITRARPDELGAASGTGSASRGVVRRLALAVATAAERLAVGFFRALFLVAIGSLTSGPGSAFPAAPARVQLGSIYGCGAEGLPGRLRGQS